MEIKWKALYIRYIRDSNPDSIHKKDPYPGRVDPDPDLDQSSTFKKKLDPIPTLEKQSGFFSIEILIHCYNFAPCILRENGKI